MFPRFRAECALAFCTTHCRVVKASRSSSLKVLVINRRLDPTKNFQLRFLILVASLSHGAYYHQASVAKNPTAILASDIGDNSCVGAKNNHEPILLCFGI
jgi:hypothetical protein